MRSALIVGCGDVGRRLGRQLGALGIQSVGVVRSETSARLVRESGIAVVRADLDIAESLAGVEPAGATVFYLAPPPSQGQQDPRIGHFLTRCAGSPPEKLVYISTSGVYGDCGGGVVTEDSPTRPQSDRAKRRLDAERQLRGWAAESGVEVVILRCGGIYGPGRLPIERLRQGMVVVCPEEAPYSNRIHSDDLARVCIAAARRGRGGEIYNVADGNQSTMTEYLYAVADAAGIRRPPCVPLAQAEQHLSPGMWSFIRESRRLDVSRMLGRLGVELRYPTLADGLRASLDAG
jgi:nucleoside-diphosphate-sugar epimerase